MVEEGKAYISALYNIGLIVLTAVTLGLLIGRITDLISHNQQTLETTDTQGKVDPE
jgi:hypothetical protein